MQVRKSRNRPQQAFSLPELLSVMAIVAIVAAALCPVFAQMRDRAQQSGCMSGRKQFIQATSVYAQDYDEGWVRRPAALAGYVRPGVYCCPLANYAGPPTFLLARDAEAQRRREAGGGGGGGSPDLVYHGGPIMSSAVTAAIFWGPSWSDPNFVGDKIAGLDTLYSGIGGSSYVNTNTEYADGGGVHVTTNVGYAGHVIDTSTAAKNGSRTQPILDEVCRMIASPVANGFYAVYVDSRRGHASYCAWHSAGSCNGVPVQFAFFFNLDGDPGCDPQDTWTGHSQGLSALGNVSGHELSEALTDPRLNAWYDSSGAENADKCAWTFANPVSFGGTSWKIQGNWSNSAYDNGRTGYANGGCIQQR